MLLNLYSMATTTTNQNRIITAIKLKRVRVWGQPAAVGAAPASVQIEWVSNQAPSTLHSDMAIGVRPAFIETKPPADSSAKWWSISGSNETEVLFKLSSVGGGIQVDIQTAVQFADDEGAVSAENGTAASATVGKVYWNYLDGFASKQLSPVGGVTVLP